MLREAFRPLLNWLFWNRRRLYAVAAAIIVVVAIIARLVTGGGGTSPHHGVTSRPAARAAAAAVTSAPPAPTASPQPSPPLSPAPVTTGAPPPAALTAAAGFLSAYVSQAADRLARLQSYTSPPLLAQLTQINPEYNPVTAVTGQPTVTSQAPGTVSLSVPTNAGPVLLTVRQSTAGQWQVTSVMPARTGN